jgi:serine/threonine-protein kinase
MPDIDRLTTALADRYRIERELGQGGMATVYLARDLRHDRLVALKVLRPELAAILGAERFLQEIKTTANLQHPHILPLHDSGEAGGNVFYVMPYVEGESLRDRLSRDKQLPVDLAVRLTREVASALDYAHRHGVVHRDIKPENILLHEGQALVADFGIALAVSRSDGGSRMTETGMSLGTPHYMSPEQAMGEREITPRSDVYALGCVAYEMLTGDPPFTGSTAQAIVARVLTEQPRTMTLQRHTIPPHVEAAVLTALEKLPADRYATAAEFSEALANPALTAARTQAAPAARFESRWRRITIATAAVALVTTGVALWAWLRPAPTRPVIRYSLGLPPAQGMQQGVLGVNLAISPDGGRLVYVGPGPQGGQLWLRERDHLDATPLPGTEGGINPFFSPDGRQIAFSSGTQYQLKVVSIGGGPPVTLADPGSGGGGGVAWSSDGWIYFDMGAIGFGRVRAGGGTPEVIVPLDTAHAELGLAWPEVLPDGKAILLRSRRSLSPDDFDIIAFDLASRQRHVLVKGLLGRYVAPGYLVYVRADGALVASRFSPSRLTLTGSPTPLLEGIMTKPFGSVDLAVSREGTLLYVPGAANAAAGEAVWVGRDGAVASFNPPLNIGPSTRRSLALSPDGTRLALDVVGPRSTDIWVKQLPAGSFSRLTFDGTSNFRPTWSPDGQSVVFISDRDGGDTLSVWRQRADGSTPAEQLLHRRTPIFGARLSRDGQWLIYFTFEQSQSNIYAVRLGQDTTPVALATSRFNELGPALSPDGQWLAYASDESGQFEIYVRPFPRTSEGRWQISTAGGIAPRWGHSGRELFYESTSGEVMVAAVTTRPTFSAAAARRLVGVASNQLWGSNSVPYWDLTPDDQRLLMVRIGGLAQAPGAGQLVVVENWLQELRGKVEAGQR